MAKKYGKHPNIIYEIYNEPLVVSWDDVIKPYAENVIANYSFKKSQKYFNAKRETL